MGLVFFEIFIVVLLLICLWISWKYIMLTISKHNADKAFNNFKENLNIEYKNVRDFLLLSQPYINDINNIIPATLDFIVKSSSFTVEKDGNERIIGYANAILNNTKNIYKEVNSIENKQNKLSDAILIFEKSQKEFNKQKEIYNLHAEILKKYVDTFPSSLIARLKKITTMDYIN